MISYPDALDLVLGQRFDWGTESLPLEAAQGAVLAEPLVTDRPQPPFDRVAMDGIAIDFADYAAGRREFPISHLQAAGDAPRPPKSGHCVEIMTGAALPEGTTTVIPYERLERGGEAFRVPDGWTDGKNLHRRGKDAAVGQELAPVGTLINGAVINLLATCGYGEVKVSKLPKISIVATGNELVDVHEKPLPHQIRRSNLYQLGSQLLTAGIQADLLHLPDDPSLLRTRIERLLIENDVLLFSGGVSKGKLDFLPEVLAELGVKKLFHRVAQKPGKPLWVGRTTRTMVFGLPGNPVSSMVGLLAYFGPFLRKNLGLTGARTQGQRELATPVEFAKPLTYFAIASIDPATQCARPERSAGSGDSASMIRSDGFLLLPAGRSSFVPGEWFSFLPFDRLLG